MKIIPSERTKNIRYAIRDIGVEAKNLEKAGKKIICLNIGDPLKYDFKTPKHLISAIESTWSKSSSYADSMGIDSAREAVSREAARIGIKGVTPEDTIITAGGSEGIIMSISALINSGDNILTPVPGYPLYNSTVMQFEGKMNEYRLNEEDEWQPDLADMIKKINSRTKAIVIINPNNPTGSVYTRSTLKRIIDIAGEHNLPIFTDETYDKLILDDDFSFTSVGSISGDVPVVTFNTLSKNYLVPGWRAGWAIFSGPRESIGDYADAVKKIARARLCTNSPVQYAIQPALEGPQDHLKDVIRKLKARRDITYKRINEIEGLSVKKPHGAFYAFPRIDVDVESDEVFVRKLLQEEGVVLVHGSGFGRLDEKYFRVVFAASEQALNDAFDKLENFVKKNYM
ncbi:MAG: aminotransferase class I/II-fold pyridoxal phosphate-dependent enzyme [Candidatus Aenigmarchaeota archaeon]|nr:aminotransferase class I/II-fold pyridoxal phosphate-dependent enzyme [Candidatus Aenigmarchaeota archaeon]